MTIGRIAIASVALLFSALAHASPPSTAPNSSATQQHHVQASNTPQHARAAIRLLRQKANHGNADAESTLGYLYEHGIGVTKDYKRAAHWYRKAAEQGNVAGQVGLATMYVISKELPRHYKQAAYWFLKAAKQGNATAQFGIAYQYQYGNGVSKNYKQPIGIVRLLCKVMQERSLN